eukprot:3526388-Pyramimonas_sp.AAC.1
MCGSSWDPRLQVLDEVKSLVTAWGGPVAQVVLLETDPEPGHPPIFRELPEVRSRGRAEHSSIPDYDNV